MKKEEFLNKLEENGLFLNKKQIEQLDNYASFLKEYNQKINLTAIDEYEEVLDKHFYDSLIGFFEIDKKASLADVGTGAGFPGVVLKICFPELKVSLIEPLKKRCIFLEELINKLGLKDIEVINQRSEDIVKEHIKYDYVTARAVSNLRILIEICGGLVRKGGYFIALKGANGINELLEADNAIKTMGFSLKETKEAAIFDGSKRVIIYLHKDKDSPKAFPRKYSIIKQKPL